MSVEITGLNELLRTLEERYGQASMEQANDRALLSGAEVFVQELERQFERFKDTGASLREITISEPMTIKGVRTVKVYWKGPENRYRIIHLNEWGTVKNPDPKGKGAIARAMRNAAEAYREAIKESLMGDI